MEKMGLNEIRKKFLDFFESKNHYVASSYPLVPQNDKSLLLINAGMAPLKNYFNGTEVPPNTKMATCQKCIRTGDIENVGITARHATMFEMLGNFSFGDYFKVESLKWGWEFVTEELKMPLDKLWVTVYLEDDDAYDIWKDIIGVPEDRIVRLGKEDNFWEIGTGPCGPCSEIYFDRGEDFDPKYDAKQPGDEGDRFVEFWNHVFTQFDKDEKGNYNPLAKPNIDTGMGLERVAAIMQDVQSIFEVDTIKAVLDEVLKASGVDYGEDEKKDISCRIITDHVRAVTFMVSDGIMPNNEGRGYVLRRLLRRAARHGKLLGIEGNFLVNLADTVIDISKDAYPNLFERKDYIKKIITIEEERFQQTLDQGLVVLNGYIADMDTAGETELSSELAFKLYDTYGFPLDLTLEILEEKNFTVDEKKFEAEMDAQRERAREARGNGDELGWEKDLVASIEGDISSVFTGYDELTTDTTITALMTDSIVSEVSEGNLTILLKETPFYAESGGQVGDRGKIETSNGAVIEITDTKKGMNDSIIHHGRVVSGTVKVGETATASVDSLLRKSTARNHTATHILHKALRDTLGGHVEQGGSYVSPSRLRFDFTHFEAMTNEEIKTVENIVNQEILKGHPVVTEIMTPDEAKKKGAMALFGEKYGDEVRVVSVGEYSTELCGGTHLSNGSEAGLFKVVSETGVAAGIRRIEAITGEAVFAMLNDMQEQLLLLGDVLKSKPDQLVNKAEQVMVDLKTSNKENEQLKQKLVSSDIQGIIDSGVDINGIKVITKKFDGVDVNTLKSLGDQIKDKIEDSLVVFGTVNEGKVVFVAMASKGAMDKGAHAGNIIREVAKVAGGGGGGKPNMAQAGGKLPEKVDDALAIVKDII